MHGERFVLLAEQAKLLSAEVADQLRQILANQRRPATGEAVARLLVSRNLLSVEQARQIIARGSGSASPLIAADTRLHSTATTRIERGVTSPSQPDTNDDDLLLAPQELPHATSAQRVVDSVQTALLSQIQLDDLTASLDQYLDERDDRAAVAASPLFQPRRAPLPATVFWFGLIAVAVMLLLLCLIFWTRWSSG